MKKQRDYVAFISYRHCPLDMKVAEHLIHNIEHYRVPKELRKNGEKTVGYVFRDRDELPLTDNLPDSIYEALDHSQFLIVVCTPETPKSRWVAREIDYFIQKHGRDRVLLVLADGTPQESIPARITRECDKDGNVIAEYEPLCAYLVDESEKKVLLNLRKELLRLMASILGCPYDDLVQRHKRYRKKQFLMLAAVLASFAVAFTGMLVDRNIKISEQLRQSQINESQALALLSQIALDDGNRFEAIKNALNALPRDGDDRPYIPAAEGALADALNIYSTLDLDYYLTVEQQTDIEKIILSDDGNYLITQDTAGCIRCFDTVTTEMLWQQTPDTFDSKYAVKLLEIVEAENIVLYSDWYTTYAFSLTDGTPLRQVSFFTYRENTGYATGSKLALSGDEKFFVQTSTPYAEQFNPDAAYAELVHYIELYDTKTFSCKGQYLCMRDETWKMDVPALSRDGSRLAFVLSNEETSEMEIYILDTNSMQPVYQNIIMPAEGEYVWDHYSYLAWLDDGTLLLYYEQRDSVNSINTYFVKINEQGEIQQVGPYYCYRSEDASADISHFLSDTHIFFNAQNVSVFALQLQTLERTMNRSTSLAGTYFTKDSNLMLATASGKIAYVTDEKSTSEDYGLYQFNRQLRLAAGADGDREIFCLVPEDAPNTVVILSEPDRTDDIEMQVPDTAEYGSRYNILSVMNYVLSPDGNRLFVMDEIESDKNALAITVYDTATLEKTDFFTFETEDDIRFESVSPNGDKLLFKGFIYDLTTRTLSDYANGDTVVGDYETLIRTPNSKDKPGRPLPAAYVNYADNTLYWWTDGTDMQSAEIPYDYEPYVSSSGLLLGEPADPAIGYSGLYVHPLYEDYRDERPLCYGLFSTKTKEWHLLQNPASCNGFSVFAVGNENETVAFADFDRMLRVYDFEKDAIVDQWPLTVSPEAITEIRYIADDRYLLLFTETDVLHLIDTQNGEEISTYDLAYSKTPGSVSVYTDKNTAYITGITQTLRIDLPSGSLLATVPDMKCFLFNSDRGIRTSADDRLTAVRIYTWEELTEKGWNLLSLRDKIQTNRS